MKRTLVVDVVGLTGSLIGSHTPRLKAFADAGGARALNTITPAVTCSVQSTFTTGTLPSEHGCVGNGWYFRDLAQVWLWRQSNHLVRGEKIWETARKRDPRFSCAKLFWWYNMHSSADLSATPRPIYRADGRKLPDIYTQPMGLRDELQAKLGTFPLFDFWGPRSSIASSRWIARCAEMIETEHRPTLNLVYLPHLDYDLQRYGPGDPRVHGALEDIDQICGDLIDMAKRRDLRIVFLSEYGITAVSGAVDINRVLRRAELVAFREELGEEHLDPGGSEAFAVADHQVAHVYLRNPQRAAEVKALLESTPGIERVLDEEGKRAAGLDHSRAGDLVAIAAADRWFTYYWWLDDRKAPDYARTVNIHSKPGYDPVELFVDPDIVLPKMFVAARLFRSKVLNVRTLLDVVSLDPSLVRGSHGRPTDRAEDGPVFLSSEPSLLPESEAIEATAVKGLVLDHLFE